jgi:hypothetical protein
MDAREASQIILTVLAKQENPFGFTDALRELRKRKLHRERHRTENELEVYV